MAENINNEENAKEATARFCDMRSQIIDMQDHQAAIVESLGDYNAELEKTIKKNAAELEKLKKTNKQLNKSIHDLHHDIDDKTTTITMLKSKLAAQEKEMRAVRNDFRKMRARFPRYLDEHQSPQHD